MAAFVDDVAALESSAAVIWCMNGWWAAFAGLWVWLFISMDFEVPRLVALVGAVSSAMAMISFWGSGMPVTSTIAAISTVFSALTIFKQVESTSVLLIWLAGGAGDVGSSDPSLHSESVNVPRSLTRAHAVVLAVAMTCQLLASWQALDEYWNSGSVPPGEMVNIGGGRWLHMTCVGSGPRVALLESGLPFSSLVWQPLMQLFEKRLMEHKEGDGSINPEVLQLRLCAYDRAGYGWSPPAWGLRTGSAIREDVNNLISARGFEQPILVGWSYGGQLAASYACQHRGKLSGLVLAEAAAPYGYFQIPDFSESWWAGVLAFRIGQILQPLGFFRILVSLGILPLQAGAPPPGLSSRTTAQIAMQTASHRFPSVALAELMGMRETDGDVASCFGGPQKWLPAPLGDVPTIVVHAGDNPQAPNSTLCQTAGMHELPRHSPAAGQQTDLGHAVLTDTVSNGSSNSNMETSETPSAKTTDAPQNEDRDLNSSWEWPQISNRTLYCSAGSDTDHFFPISKPEVILEALEKLLTTFSSQV